MKQQKKNAPTLWESKVRTWYYANGQMRERIGYSEDGEMHGWREYWDEDGTLRLRECRVYGELHGLREWFNKENGELSSRELWEDGFFLMDIPLALPSEE